MTTNTETETRPKAKANNEISSHRDLWLEVGRIGRQLARLEGEMAIGLVLLAAIIAKLLFAS